MCVCIFTNVGLYDRVGVRVYVLMQSYIHQCKYYDIIILISLKFSFTGRVGLFGRKANPYVKATYGSIEKLSPTYVCDNDSPLSDKALVFNVTEVNSLVRKLPCDCLFVCLFVCLFIFFDDITLIELFFLYFLS